MDQLTLPLGISQSLRKQEVIHGARYLDGIKEAQTVANDADETSLWDSNLFDVPEMFQPELTCEINAYGTLSSDGAVDHTLTLQWVEADGTVIDLLELVTVGAANEDDVEFDLKFVARFRTVLAAATSKIIAYGRMDINFGTPVILRGISALAGVTADLTQAGFFRITEDMDGANADADIIVHSLTAKLTR